jgi:hypothetical protein
MLKLAIEVGRVPFFSFLHMCVFIILNYICKEFYLVSSGAERGEKCLCRGKA